MSDPHRPGSILETFLSLFFVFFVGGVLLAFFALITMGALVWVLAVPVGMFVLIAIHYVLWGWMIEARRREDAPGDEDKEGPA